MVFLDEGFPGLVDVLFYMAVLLLVFVVFKALEYLSRRSNLKESSYKYHCWKSAKCTNQVLFCSKCSTMLDEDGLNCVCCGLATDRDCLSTVNRTFKCKEITSHHRGPMKHYWVLGNIAVGYYCYVCEEDCSSEPGLTDYRCVWCDTTVHSRCKEALGEVCDFGKFKSFVVPPQHVYTLSKRVRIPPSSSIRYVERLEDPHWTDWTPLFVLGNSKSGNGKGEDVLCLMRRYLNPLQVVDLSVEGAIKSLLRVVTMLPLSAKPKFLVAGGDGSVAWLLSDLEASSSQIMAPVGIIPLGTGNDLSRVLGWGSQEPDNLSAEHIFSLIDDANTVQIDRWKVGIRRWLRFGGYTKAKELFMYNYLSVGVDAMVTLKFHNTRKSPFYLFSSRIINKMMYLWYGADQVLEPSCKDLESKVELYLDGVRAELPAVESIVILNIPSWGAGVPLWQVGRGLGEESEEEGEIPSGVGEQRIDDGLVEVAAIYSSFHIAQLQVGLSRPLRIGQARHVRLKLKQRLPMQIDGEPWMQGAGEINICLHNRASVLKLNSTT